MNSQWFKYNCLKLYYCSFYEIMQYYACRADNMMVLSVFRRERAPLYGHKFIQIIFTNKLLLDCSFVFTLIYGKFRKQYDTLIYQLQKYSYTVLIIIQSPKPRNSYATERLKCLVVCSRGSCEYTRCVGCLMYKMVSFWHVSVIPAFLLFLPSVTSHI